jgi:hypothetical protein
LNFQVNMPGISISYAFMAASVMMDDRPPRFRVTLATTGTASSRPTHPVCRSVRFLPATRFSPDKSPEGGSFSHTVFRKNGRARTDIFFRRGREKSVFKNLLYFVIFSLIFDYRTTASALTRFIHASYGISFKYVRKGSRSSLLFV